MRIFIGDPTTRRFLKMVEVFVIDPSPTDDCILYVQDPFGNFYTLTFPDPQSLSLAMGQLHNNGYATALCHLDYYYPNYTNDEQDREIDPYKDIEEREYL